MVDFKEITIEQFLTDYWQKKPLVIRQALPNFRNPLAPDELAGLALEEEIESRIVFETPKQSPYWHLKRGPFVPQDFKDLPKTYWTLLVQGVDRFLPKVNLMFDHFDFLPQWRVDDVMISYAVEHGSVGPHYDNYDVFLYQAIGTRKWSLTTKKCNAENHLPGIELRIMKDFQTEEEHILGEGDMLYLPPHVGHHGIAVSKDCMTYSFGYRSYGAQELLENFTDYLAQTTLSSLYKDPDWNDLRGTSELPKQAWKNAQTLMKKLLVNEEQIKSWFGCFVTRLDLQAEELLPQPLAKGASLDKFNRMLGNNQKLLRNPLCRFAYQEEAQGLVHLFINGEQWNVEGVSVELIKLIANSRLLHSDELRSFLEEEQNRFFLFKLWKLQWLDVMEAE
ncbi:cupin [Legionella lansingensis]|uniref:Cupin n=1 Tax=Legionella lansingensis TaxID=45067 RepID=A0A0W0VQR6_9GAMM|nr:cupin domain-containing protein [Legionella lansingensis]KTD22269.1 cupin [Legionella lansingensis]SNV50601.1 cupin [Legionella lansingensis]